MSRQNLSRADKVYKGRVSFPLYEGDKYGLERTLYFRWKPVGVYNFTFTGSLAAGATSGTLSANWAGPSGLHPITFSDTEVLMGLFTNGATTCTFWPASPPITGGSYGAGGATGSSGQAALNNAVTSAASISDCPPQVGVSNAISTSASISAGGLAVLSGTLANTAGTVATMDVPRNVIGAWTTSSTVTVTGTDYYGQPQTEVQTGSAFTGKKAFATVTSIKSSAAVTAATFGTGNVLGLPFHVRSGDILAAMFNDAADAGTFVAADLTNPPTTSTGDVRGTYTPAGTLNGAKYLVLPIKPWDDTSQVGSFGNTPV